MSPSSAGPAAPTTGDDPLGPATPGQPRHLRLLQRTAEAVTRATSVEKAAAAVLAELCRAGPWPAASLALVDQPSGRLRRLWYGPDLELIARLRAATEGHDADPWLGPAAEVLATGRPASVAGPGTPATAPPALGAPVTVAEEVVAVVEVFGAGAGLLDLVGQVGHQLARVVERARAREALERAEERLQALTAAARDGIVVLDGGGAVVDANPAAERLLRYPPGGLRGSDALHLVADRDRAALRSALRALSRGSGSGPGELADVAGLRRDGSEVPLELALSAWRAGGERFITAVAVDLSSRRELEQERAELERRLAERALHDPLTHLPNRALLRDRIDRALDRAAHAGGALALVCLDLDRFRVVNDSLGLTVGDQLLRWVAERLKAVLRPGDTLARLGSDEFAIVFDDVSDRDEGARLADLVMGAMAQPFDAGGREVSISACLGVALVPGSLGTADHLLRDAEVALSRARQRGVGQREIYDDAMRGGLVDRLAVESDLRRAIHQAQLRLYYQPIVEVATGALVGAEALIRWQHPSRGLLLPSQFIALAEECGLIVPLGAWVLEEALQQLAAWAAEGGDTPAPRVSVNVSARQFQHDGWAHDVAAVLRATGADPDRVVLEITESVLMEDTTATVRRLGRLRDLGLTIAIDDFGTGYSSLGYLRQFPVDILKIDKTFIDGVALGPHESALAKAMIRLAGTLRLETVAEGVAAREQYVALRRLRCRFAQGFFFSRPQPPDALRDLRARPTLVPDQAVPG